MKKVLGLTLITLLFTSCWNNNTIDENTDNNSAPVIENNVEIKVKEVPSNNEEEIIEKSIDEIISWENDGIINETDWTEDIEINTDEEALETEVNVLLDEFIDSLENYDK